MLDRELVSFGILTSLFNLCALVVAAIQARP